MFLLVVQGAGGMLMIDPLFQRVLVNECRSRNIPVIFDEVFTGFWRLGVEVGCPWPFFANYFYPFSLLVKLRVRFNYYK